jgi:hypothetical protein
MRTYDKSLTEVWEWKESVYNEAKGLSATDYVRKMTKDADTLLSEGHIELIPFPASGKREKVA